MLTQQAVHAVQYSVVQQTVLHYSSAHSEVAVNLIRWTDKQYRWLRPTYLTLLSSPLFPIHLTLLIFIHSCLQPLTLSLLSLTVTADKTRQC